jgi:hypothetical protein
MVGKKSQLDNSSRSDEPLSTGNHHPMHSFELTLGDFKGGLLSAKLLMVEEVGNEHRNGRVQTMAMATCAKRNGQSITKLFSTVIWKVIRTFIPKTLSPDKRLQTNVKRSTLRGVISG